MEMSYCNDVVKEVKVTAPKLGSERALEDWRKPMAGFGLDKWRSELDLGRTSQLQGLLNFRVAVLISKAAFLFMEGKESAGMKETDKMEEEMEEAIATRYYCHRCCHAVTVDSDIKCPVCNGSFIQVCEEVTSLYLTMPSESEHSETDADGEGPIGYDPDTSEFVITLSFDSRDENDGFDEPHHGIRATSSEWVLLLTTLGLEILSAGFDQVSSPSKPHYALIGLLLAIVAILACVWELLRNGIKEGVVLRRRGMLWCFYYPPPRNIVYGTFPDIFGLGLAIVQCICSAVQYYFIHRHATNPIKLSPVPAVFFFSLIVSKSFRNQGYIVDVDETSIL